MKRTLILAVLTLLASGAPAAQFNVGSGASVDLGTGSLDLGCADLDVTGTFSSGTSGITQARDVTIAPAGIVNGESATLEVTGDWDNTGTFNAGTGTVQMVDGCSLASAVINGNTTFNNLAMSTSSGFLYTFTSGSATDVSSDFEKSGASGNLLTIRASAAGFAASLNANGTISGNGFVDVMDNRATSSPILLGPDGVKGSNSNGWFLASTIPMLPPIGLAALGAGLLWRTRRALGLRR